MQAPRVQKISGQPGRPSPKAKAILNDESVGVLVAERARFQRFVASRIGSASDADDVLQDSLLRAMERGEGLRRGERVVAWFYRILRNAIADHYREKKKDVRQKDRLWQEVRSLGEDRSAPPADWEAAVCKCFRGLMPALKPRYAEVLLRIELRGEEKRAVARDLKVTPATLDVLLHRARQSLRERLEIFCGACSRESCLACACETRARVRTKKV